MAHKNDIRNSYVTYPSQKDDRMWQRPYKGDNGLSGTSRVFCEGMQAAAVVFGTHISPDILLPADPWGMQNWREING